VSSPFVGEIRMFGGNFAPQDWAFCDGSLLSIAQNQALFALIGTTYGGDGVQTFALPDLRGRVPVHQGSGFPVGQVGGAEQVTLVAGQLPAHAHTLLASAAPAQATAEPGGSLTAIASAPLYSVPGAQLLAMEAGAVGLAGGSQAHDNVAPFLCVNFIISLFGIFPSQN
jgi:microcystin-dependent protein